MSSWLTGIASKASSLLESVDEYAANSIQSIVTTATGVEAEEDKETAKKPHPLPNLPLPHSQKEADWSYPSPEELRDGTSRQPLKLDIPPPAQETGSERAVSDEKLLEFLNDPTASTPLTDIPLSTTDSPPDIIKTAIVYTPEELPQYSDPNTDTLALENESLRKSVSASKADLGLMQEHWHQSQREVSNLTRDVTQLRQDLSEAGERQAKLNDKLETRESRLEAQTMQIEVMRRELEKTQKLIQDSDKNDRETQQSPPGVVSDLRVEIATLQSRLSSSEVLQLREGLSLQKQIEQVTAVNEKLSDNLIETEKRANQLAGSFEQLRSQLRGAETELTDYKHKATTVLQGKDKLIDSLRDQISQPVTELSDGNQLEEVKRLEDKCASLAKEVRECREESEEKTQSLTTRSERLTQERDNFSTQISLFQTQAEDKENAARILERQNESLKSQLSSQQAELTARDITITELEGQLARSVSHPDPSSQDLQGRVRALTDTVIQKQRSIEALCTENNTLKLQVDKLTQRLGQSDSLISDSSGKSKLRHITSLPLPQACPPRFGRNFESVVTRLDLLSLRLGVYFRQYPYARLLCILYLCMFHLLFLYVLVK